jgi:hypothetical protein
MKKYEGGVGAEPSFGTSAQYWGGWPASHPYLRRGLNNVKGEAVKQAVEGRRVGRSLGSHIA